MAYTVEVARRRIPEVLKTVALSAIDAAIILDTLPINSREFESRVWSLQGSIAHLMKLYMTIAKAEIAT